MRIHHLRIEAFGPFATEVTVDLDSLSDAGLFLLTGATGAGKTSVLDAICFALYGAVPGDRQAAKRLRSDQAADGLVPSVTLEFTVQGRRFLIDRSPAWERPKKRGSGLTKEQASVLVRERVDGEWRALATRLDEAGHLVSGLLGMTLTQFCQVQMLPQGRFQAFLRADSHQRHELLQQLFRTTRFEDVETWLRDRRRELRRESVRHHEIVADLVSRLSEAANRPLPDAWDLHDLDPVVAHLTTWAESMAAAAEHAADAAFERVKNAVAAARGARDRLDAGRVLAERQLRLTRALAESRALADEQADHRARLHRLQAGRRAEAVLPLAELADRTAADHATAVSDAATACGLVAALLGHELPPDELQQRQREATDAAARARAYAPRVAERDRLATQIEASETRLREVAAALTEADERLSGLPAALAARRTTEAEAVRAADRLEAAGLELVAARERRDAGRQVAELVGQRAEVQDLLRQSVDHTQVVTQEWLHLQELRLTGMAAEIAGAMAVGACCPVCGSAEHPHLAEPRPGAPDADTIRAARKVVDDAEIVRQAREGAVTDLEVRITHARERAGNLALTVLEREVGVHEARVERLTGQADTLPAAREARETTERELGDLTARHTALEAERAALDAGLLERRDRVAAIDADIAALLADTGHTAVGALAAHLDDVADACAGARAAVRERDRLSRATDETRQRALAEAVERGFTDLTQARAMSLTADELVELDQLVSAWAARHAAVTTALADPDLVAAGEADAPDVPALEAARAARDTELNTARADATATRRRSDRLDRLGDDLVGALDAWVPVRDQLDLADRMASMADGSSPDNRLKMRLSGYVLAFRLRQVVAAANERLVAMTDGRYRLEHTGDRGAGESRGGLSLLVRDDWSGESRDPVTLSGGETFVVSLALALGLADVIAHEAGGSELDTLFVDEGFGTLDADTLDDVMDTLDSLRDGGRVVGVVSHVAELRDRIPTQLHVRKQRSGSTVHQAGSS